MIRIKQVDSFHLCVIYLSIHCFERGIYPENLHTFYVVLLKKKKHSFEPFVFGSCFRMLAICFNFLLTNFT